MDLFEPQERDLAVAVGGLVRSNPFLPERIEWERRALGCDFRPDGADWNLRSEVPGDHPNLEVLAERVGRLLEAARTRMLGPGRPSAEDLDRYEDLAFFHLYNRRREGLFVFIRDALERPSKPGRVEMFEPFLEDVERYLGSMPGRRPSTGQAAHLFACFFQIRRGFHLVFRSTVGRSAPAARLRAAVWESIFTHDIRRYWSGLFDRMGDFTTLVTGPTGTGKELVARAIGHSRYIPFDPATRTFTADFTRLFLPLNLEALPPDLIESELFGHRKGAFTGAVEDRAGWLESCPRAGTVFLDEIGELDAKVQVKLLRVLQDRTFHRVGETRERHFPGKILAATNRDPEELLRRGRMRPDFYYRICSDLLAVPSLRERLDDDPGELEVLVRHLARREAGETADALAEEALEWIPRNLGDDYPWPGNIRELDQCLRNLLVRGSYTPPPAEGPRDPLEEVVRGLRDGTLGAEDLLGRYCAWVYHRTGSYLEAARRLGLDRRTVKARVDEAFLRRLR